LTELAYFRLQIKHIARCREALPQGVCAGLSEYCEARQARAVSRAILIYNDAVYKVVDEVFNGERREKTDEGEIKE
jgi:hypothetical protein